MFYYLYLKVVPGRNWYPLTVIVPLPYNDLPQWLLLLLFCRPPLSWWSHRNLNFLMLLIHLLRFYLEHGYQNYCWLIITLVSYQGFVTFIRVLKIFPQSEFSTKFLCVLDNIYVFFFRDWCELRPFLSSSISGIDRFILVALFLEMFETKWFHAVLAKLVFSHKEPLPLWFW